MTLGTCLRLCFFLFFIYVYRGEGREKERERNINVWLPLLRPLLGTWPATQACAPSGNRTLHPWLRRPGLNPLSHSSQGREHVSAPSNKWRRRRGLHTRVRLPCYSGAGGGWTGKVRVTGALSVNYGGRSGVWNPGCWWLIPSFNSPQISLFFFFPERG